jgi:hypothetical protein
MKVSEGKGTIMRHSVTVLSCIILISLLSGCAKFSASRKMDAGPFGENTTVMMVDIAADMGNKKPFHTKQYIYGPNVQDYQAEVQNVKKLMRGIVLYSTQVVNISQSNMSEKKKPNALANIWERIASQIPDARLADFGLTREELAVLIRNIEKQDNMLDALAESQELVDRVAAYSDKSFDRTEVALNKLILDITERMDTRWALTRSNVESLLALQGRTIKSYSLLYQYREGDPAGLDSLRENDPALQTQLGKGHTPGDKDLEVVEAQLMSRLKNLYSIREQVWPQVEQYLAESRERDDLVNQHREAGKKLRTTMMLWQRSHRNLSIGIPVPAEIDLYSILVGAGKKAVGL